MQSTLWVLKLLYKTKSVQSELMQSKEVYNNLRILQSINFTPQAIWFYFLFLDDEHHERLTFKRRCIPVIRVERVEYHLPGMSRGRVNTALSSRESWPSVDDLSEHSP